MRVDFSAAIVLESVAVGECRIRGTCFTYSMAYTQLYVYLTGEACRPKVRSVLEWSGGTSPPVLPLCIALYVAVCVLGF